MLAALISRHRGPLSSDLHQYHRIRLARIKTSGYSLEEIADFAANLPPDGALARALRPGESGLTADSYLLREMEQTLRVLVWQRTADGSAKNPKHYPERLPLTAEEVEAKKPTSEYDVSSIEEMREFLGWTDLVPGGADPDLDALGDGTDQQQERDDGPADVGDDESRGGVAAAHEDQHAGQQP